MEKEMVQKFDLEAAFKALDEIETPKAKGLKANRVDLKERFAAKTYGDALIEDYYNINDHEALEEAKEDREEEIAKAKLARIEKIVDLDAESPDDLLPSYVGKVIIQCPQCMTLFYKNPEDIEKSEENPDVVNINEICQHCGNASGYTLIGKVGEVSPDEAANYEAAEEPATEEENELNLDFGEPTEEVSPEGTGGGFEEEEIAVEEGSEDSSDDELDLEAIDLEPTEESLKHEQLNEEVEDTKVEVEAEKILDAAAKAGKEVAKEVEADLTKAEVKEITDEVVTKELELPVVEEDSDDSSDDELKENLNEGAAEIAAKLDAYAASLGVDEGYKGTPEERTTHLEYTDGDPTDGKAVLPKNIEKQLTEEEKKDCDCKDGICECGDKNAAETPLAEGKYDVSDAEFKSMLQDKVFQEFGENLTEDADETPARLPSAGEVQEITDHLDEIGEEIKAEAEAEEKGEEPKVKEDINITNNDSPARVDNRTIEAPKADEKPVEEGIGSAVSSVVDGVANGVKSLLASDEAEKKDCEDCKEGILSAVDSVVGGVAKGVENLLASDEAEKKDIKECAKTEEGLGLFGIGDVNVNLDASGQNNAVGVGGGEGKTESCEGPKCKEEKHVCEKCGKEPCECKEEELLPDLSKLPTPSLPGLGGLPGLSEKCEDLHEESLNKHISDYLTEVYANVKNFEATNCSFKGNTLVVEGIINFNSGKTRTTKFEFTESKDGELGRVILEGYNKELAEDSHFTLNCLLENGGKCLVTEGFGYKYTINNILVEGLK